MEPYSCERQIEDLFIVKVYFLMYSFRVIISTIVRFYGLNTLMYIRLSSQCLEHNKHSSDTRFLFLLCQH